MGAVGMPLLPRTARRNTLAGVRQNAGYGLTLLLVLQLAPVALAKCPNWCSQHGICTGPGDDAFCICEMGFQGDDCATSEWRFSKTKISFGNLETVKDPALVPTHMARTTRPGCVITLTQ